MTGDVSYVTIIKLTEESSLAISDDIIVFTRSISGIEHETTINSAVQES